MILNSPLVSVEWLADNLNNSNLIVLDGSMSKVTTASAIQNEVQIPNARYFDIKTRFSNTSDPFPNAVPSVEQFKLEAQSLGINNSSFIVVYDEQGIYSSARVWYLFRAFGYKNIAVLDGGLPEWLLKGYRVETKQRTHNEIGDFNGSYDVSYFKYFEDMSSVSEDENVLICDARSNQRFNGTVPEPRKGLRSGHIPNSVSLPFSTLLEGNCLKNKSELNLAFDALNRDKKDFVFTCGSGITACVLALAAEIVGNDNYSVYDGSWTEYGSLTN